MLTDRARPGSTAAIDMKPVLEAVRAAWQEVLPFEKVSDHRNWADAGGDSLDAFKILALLEISLGQTISQEVISMETTPVTLAWAITGKNGVGDPGDISRDPVSG